MQTSVGAVQAATAADLAALAGADALRGLQPTGQRSGPVTGSASGAAAGPGPAGACGVAGEVAARNNAALRKCSADPEAGILTVEAQVRVPALPYPATATARAGPPG
ncbi:hypothetical protein [Arthrobacter sp. zg-Y877]|uniref:hypothetical protein n=1 Tax=Arthrobacter sp. zg-Y877 TaxID=3049074 RepID=UPI0025A4AFB3|nr:hypothetical protein [Arthrobacter sp. zg-Y877]MDM7990194.1 hypothetical protein [Arthrobacter sp. zg-Y877]